MRIIKENLHQLLDPCSSLMLMGGGMLERIINNPSSPLMERVESGYCVESIDIYDPDTSLLDLCRQGQADGSRRMDVSYDFFFGGDKRSLYPDSPLTVQGFKAIHDLAKEHGMGFCASIISPLDTGGEYVKTHEKAGQSMQFQEGAIREDGTYEIVMDYQTQWTNNKGPVDVVLSHVRVFAFDEEQIEGTPYFYVNEREIEDISDTVQYEVDPTSLCITAAGYGHGNIRIYGKTSCQRTRFLAVIVYRTQELDYFSDDALEYMKSIIDLHKEAGIEYDGIYSDEMHIQFDWDMLEHWGEQEIATRYMTDSMAQAYAELYGEQYRDFAKYLIYFTYQSHRFLPDEAGALPAQHVFGKTQDDIARTFLFRQRYFDLLHRRVVDLCTETKRYTEELYGHKIQTTGHSTWQESPTADTRTDGSGNACYDYTDAYGWSAAHRENISACNDHFKWNEFFRAVGTDISEGGFLDRNYYGAALTAGLAALNPAEMAYYCIWGAPDAVKERLAEVGQSYGHFSNYCKNYDVSHHILQGYTARLSDVLTLYPVDLNYLEVRFGNWMAQYGYTDYITEEKLLEHVVPTDGPLLRVKNRTYRAVVVPFSPLMSAQTLSLLEQFVRRGGKVFWCSMPALRNDDGAANAFKRLFGIAHYDFALRGIAAAGARVRFHGLQTVADMHIPTDLFPDFVYPVIPLDASPIADLNNRIVGTCKTYPGGGKAVYLGFRVRDDQSCSTGKDIDTLFAVLKELGAYELNGSEAVSRPADSRYLYHYFPNGTVSLCNHFRTFQERDWPFGFLRDEEKDQAFMQNIPMPPHDIHLQDALINGHHIQYLGEGIVSYRYTEEDGLLGFAGRNTCGITIDGAEYIFAPSPMDISWGKVDNGILDEAVSEAYFLKCNQIGSVHLPFDADGMHCSLCKNYMLDTVGDHPFRVIERSTYVDITPESIGKWIIFYK